MAVDWTQFAAGAPAGGVDWGQHSGVAPIVKAPKVKAVKSSSGGGGNWFTNTVSDIEGTIHGAANAVVGLGSAIGSSALQLAHAPAIHASGGGFEIGGNTDKNQGLDINVFARNVVDATRQQYEWQYGPLVHGDVHTFLKRWHEHPLGPVLDLASIVSLGGTTALRAARVGALGERLGEVANTERILNYRDLHATLPDARTLHGRLLQRQFDRYTMREHIRDLPGVGAGARVGRRTETLARRRQFALRQKVKGEFRRISAKATPQERFAAPIAAEGVPIPELLDHYRRLQEESPTRTRARYIRVLENPKIQEAIDTMRPELLNLVHAGRELERVAGERAMAGGILEPDVRAARAVLPQRLVAGARFEGERTVRVPGEDRYADVRSAMKKDLAAAEKAHTAALKRVTSLTERVRAHTDRITYAGSKATSGHRMNLSRARNELARARATLKDAEQSRDFQRESLSNVPGRDSPQSIRLEGDFNGPPAERFQGAPNRVHPDLPEPFRFPHIGTHGGAGIYSVPLARLSKVLRPGFTKRNEGIRFGTARMIRDPDAWLQDHLTGMRYQDSIDWQRAVLEHVKEHLDPQLDGGKHPDEEYYRPSFEQKTPPRVPREISDETAARADLGFDTEKGSKISLERHAGTVVSDELPHDLAATAREKGGIEKLSEQGVYRVPKRYAQVYKREFSRVSPVSRLMFDKPTDVWRAFTLKFRPAWTVNNIVGQHILFAMHHAGPAGAIAYLHALKLSKDGDAKLRKIAALHIPLPSGWGRTVGRAIDEIAPELHGSGFATSQVRITDPGLYRPVLDRSAAARAARRLGMTAKAPYVAVKSFGDANAWLNAHIADNLPRDAAFLTHARPHIRAIQAEAKKLEGVNLTLQDAIRKLGNDRPLVEKLVDQTLRELGDFSNMGHIERTVLRRIIPFYSWFKVITQLTARYARDYPARINMLRAIENFTTEKDAELPSWLEGAIPLGPAVGGVQPMLSTAGINPFETIVQLAETGKSLVSGKPQFGTANPGGLLNPFLQSAITGLSNRDLFSGSDYHGAGENRGALGVAAGDFFTGLPQTRLYTTSTGGYQSSLYENTPEDYLLNYFGWPIRKVNLRKARALAKEGR